MRIKPELWWTWAIQTHDGTRWELCCGYMALSKADLRAIGEKPSPEARAVRVRVGLAKQPAKRKARR